MKIKMYRRTVNGLDLTLFWGRFIAPVYESLASTAVPVMRPQYHWQLRLSWGQVALWRDYRAIVDLRNPLVWHNYDRLRRTYDL